MITYHNKRHKNLEPTADVLEQKPLLFDSIQSEKRKRHSQYRTPTKYALETNALFVTERILTYALNFEKRMEINSSCVVARAVGNASLTMSEIVARREVNRAALRETLLIDGSSCDVLVFVPQLRVNKLMISASLKPH